MIHQNKLLYVKATILLKMDLLKISAKPIPCFKPPKNLYEDFMFPVKFKKTDSPNNEVIGRK